MRLSSAIVGGSHTYSRGWDQFPSNYPEILRRGKGAYVWDHGGRKLLDYGMGLRSVGLGYSEESVNKAAIREIRRGNSLTLPHFAELNAAEKIKELIPGAELVKFAKNGSNVTTAAVKLARAYTGRDKVVVPSEHPFFSFDDWFIGSTVMAKGTGLEGPSTTLTFNFLEVDSLQMLFDANPEQIACVILEPTTHVTPCSNHASDREVSEARGGCQNCRALGETHLMEIQKLCRRHGALLIVDEMITGFRWSIQGAAPAFGIQPDLLTFGKAIANGFSLAFLAGKKEIMQLGAIEPIGLERTFLLSSTHGAEMGPLGAFVRVAGIYQEKGVINHLWDYGKRLREIIQSRIIDSGLGDSVQIVGSDVLQSIVFSSETEERSRQARTLFLQEMLVCGVMMPWISPSFRHDARELRLTEKALDHSLPILADALRRDDFSNVRGPIVKPVFRKFN